MAEQDFDRTEAATPYKLEQARERGQVGKSADVVSALVFAVAAALLYWKGWDGLTRLFGYDQALLVHAGRMQATPATLWQAASGMVRDGVAMLVPFLGAILIAAIVGNLAQTGPILTAHPIKPDFERLNIASGFKRLLSVRTLFDCARALVKLTLLALVVYHALKALFPQFLQLSALPVGAGAKRVVDAAASTSLKIALLLCLVAAADWAFTRREFAKKMRMSRRELKDEHKHREGDPRIRARLRELRREALRRSLAARRTASADVVVTNPTHFAVALRYEHGAMQSPQVVAKGSGVLAAAMRKIAARHRVPVVQNPPLAREMYKTLEVDQFVPPQLYAQVARILVWIVAMREARNTNRGAAA
jgi:flagellar biosynthetic protein FlhB